MKLLALWAIRFYQRFISPHKGFRCAYAAHTGCASCSMLGYRAIRRFGVLGGVGVLNARLVKCGVAHRRYRPARSTILASQAGNCDGDCDCAELACDLDGCDFESNEKSKKKSKKKSEKKPERDEDVVLPPRRAGN